MNKVFWKTIATAAVVVGLIAGCGANNPSRPAKPVSGKPINVAPKVNFGKELFVPPAVRAECRLDTQLPEFIESFARNAGVNVIKTGAAPGAGRVLKLEYTNIVGTAGGAYSGAKSVTVEGKLYENGKLIGSFTGRRVSGGGAFAGYKGTCSILGRCVKALGQDIARWLEAPSMNARLGDI